MKSLTDLVLDQWYCDADSDTQLSQSEVLSYVGGQHIHGIFQDANAMLRLDLLRFSGISITSTSSWDVEMIRIAKHVEEGDEFEPAKRSSSQWCGLLTTLCVEWTCEDCLVVYRGRC